MRHIDFENIEDKFDKVLATKEWQQLQKDFSESSDIYIVANGGLWAVGQHGWNNLFLRWLELQRKTGKMNKDAMILGLSCSGGSKNVVSCCHWAKKYGYKTAMIAGQDRGVLGDKINNVVMDCKYFHTVEVLTLILFYDLIHACGAECPTISDEVIRKGTAQPLARNPLNGG